MSYCDEALCFDCNGEALVGILSMPRPEQGSPQTADVGVVIIVGGPQYRAGSHRQFTLLSRATASAGYPTLRFDYRGMGDATGTKRDFTHVVEDVQAAIEALIQRQSSVTRIVLWGLCDGASAALLYLHATRDPRVRGLALANPWVRSEASLARTHVKHYYLRRLVQREFWSKAIRGQVGGKAASDLWRNLSRSLSLTADRISPRGGLAASLTYQQRMAEAAAAFRGKVLLLISGNDLTAKEFLEHVAHEQAWKSALSRHEASRHDFPHADHTFSGPKDLQALLQSTVQWLHGLDGRFDVMQSAQAPSDLTRSI